MSDMMQGLQGYTGQPGGVAQQQYVGQHMLVDPNQQQMVAMAGQMAGQPAQYVIQNPNMLTGFGFDQQNAMMAGLQGMMPGVTLQQQPQQLAQAAALPQVAQQQAVGAVAVAAAPTGKQVFKGTVKRWNVQKGFGFIEPAPSEGTNDVFVHHTVVHSPGFKSLCVHSEIEYEREPAPGLVGRYRATRVTGPGGSYAKSANSGNTSGSGQGKGSQGGNQGGGQQGQQQQLGQQQQQNQQQQAAAAAQQQQQLMGMGNVQQQQLMGQMGQMANMAGQLPAGMMAAPQNPAGTAQLGAAAAPSAQQVQQMQLLYMQQFMQPQSAAAGAAATPALAGFQTQLQAPAK
eukprot:TRINITY_DN597_c0_g7_i1.p2 TRINITY_DN597_c0_g7~~TRINITY_DN597_c0_g7_i1.p2  ORF type:complete len:343 (+),score=120.82 TRINITY_DN597_c0_g7_i1:71-1099(+)